MIGDSGETTGYDQEWEVPVYRPVAWALTMYQEQVGDDRGRWRPCVALWMADMDEFLDGLECPGLGVDVGRVDRFAAVAFVPAAYKVLDPPVGHRPPDIRCYLGAYGCDPDDRDAVAVALDVPAAAATSAALANHDDEYWNMPLLLVAGEPQAPGEPVLPRTAHVAVFIDQTPLAEGVGGSDWFPESLLVPAGVAALSGLLRDTLTGMGLGGPEELHGAQVQAHVEVWTVVSGLAAGHPVSARRALDLAEAVEAGMVQAAQEGGASTPPWLFVVLSHAAVFNNALGVILAEDGERDLVRDGMDALMVEVNEGAGVGKVAASGLLARLDAELWAAVAAADGPQETLTLMSEAGPSGLLLTVLAQAAVRAESASATPAGYLAMVLPPPGEADRSWPLLSLQDQLAAHDTVVLRSLLGSESEIGEFCLEGLLHSIQGALSTQEWLADATVEALKGSARQDAARDGLEFLQGVQGVLANGGCACDLLDGAASESLVDGMCAVLPVMGDVMATRVIDDEGSEQWVEVRDSALHALLHVAPHDAG